LGREIDQINLKHTWRIFREAFLLPPRGALGQETGLLQGPRSEHPLHSLRSGGFARMRHSSVKSSDNATALRQESRDAPFWLWRVYRRDIPILLRHNLMPMAIVVVAQVVAFVIGWSYAGAYPLPSGVVDLQVPDEAFESLPNVGFLPGFTVTGIMFHNLRALVLEAVAGFFSFGTIAIVLLMMPLMIIGFFTGQVPAMGAAPGLFLATFILPHGIVELPAAIVATTMALRLGVVVISPPAGKTVTEGVLGALADFLKVFLFLVIPLLVVAAMLEVWLTPWIVTRVW
jgi:uncharacterized membrane protein SpoIIM required for sporulation